MPVLCVDLHAGDAWRTTWGLWNDEVDALDLQACVAADDGAPHVCLDRDERVLLPRGYAVLDPERLRQHLTPRAPAASAPFELARGNATTIDAGHVVIDGTRADAAFVVDCRGGEREPRCAQTAVGAFVRGVHETVLMDFSLEHDDDDPRPSFGYVVPVAGGCTLVEETSLGASPPMPRATLERRLAHRLETLGMRAEGDEREWVSIPLDARPGAGLHDRGVAHFGVRGGVVHPATGYALAHTLKEAPRVADAIRAALERGAPAEQIARAASDAAWSTARRLSYVAFRFGRDVLLGLDLAGQRAFFRAFFSLAGDDQRAFLTSSSPPQRVLVAMSRMWPRLPWKLRAQILGTRGSP